MEQGAKAKMQAGVTLRLAGMARSLGMICKEHGKVLEGLYRGKERRLQGLIQKLG